MTQKSVVRFFLLGLPIGLAISIVIALPIYYRLQDKQNALNTHAGRQTIASKELSSHQERLIYDPRFGPSTARVPLYIESILNQWHHGYKAVKHGFPSTGREATNIMAELPGYDTHYRRENIVLAAKFDPSGTTTDVSGPAGLLAIAQALGGTRHQRSVQFVFLDEAASLLASAQPEPAAAAHIRYMQSHGRPITAFILLESLSRWHPSAGTQQPVPGAVSPCPTQGDFLALSYQPPGAALGRAAQAWFTRSASLLRSSLLVAAPTPLPSPTLSSLPWVSLSDTGTLRTAPPVADLRTYHSAVVETLGWIRELANPRNTPGS